MYLAATNHSVNAILIRLDLGIQNPIFYVSKNLVDVETHYLPLEKAVLAVIRATQKLPHHFQARTIVVLTEHPLQEE